MARKKLNLEDIEMEVANECTEEVPKFPEIPLPEQPTVAEQIAMATEELENKCNDLVQQIYYKEQEIAQLRAALEDQARKFEITMANFVYDVYGR